MRSFWHDLRVASRLLRQSPGLSLAAIVTMALGIGANATIYSFADAVLFRPLDVPGAERLVHVFERREQPGTYPLPFADYPVYRARATSFDALAAHYSGAPLHALIDGAPEALTGAVATASYFEVLQLRPAIGRFYSVEEDRERERHAVAVVSHSLWQRRFGGDVGVLGRTLTLNGRVFTIIGVAPARFTGVQARGAAVDVWIPSAMFAVGYRYCDAFAPGCTIVQLLGRLKSGVALEQAQRELDGLAAQMATDPADARKRLGVIALPARGLGYGAESSERRQLNVFLGAVTLVLLIACANIAGLLLARATARRRHLAVRLAMGASRLRIVSHVLAESVVLAAIGGAAGLVAATWSTDLLASLYAFDSAGRPLTFALSLNAPVVLVSLGLTLLAAVLAGGVPAWQASRADVMAVLKDEGASGGARRAYLRQLLVGAQVAVSVVLLVGALLLIGSADRALQGPGFDPEPVVALRLRPSLVDFPRDRAHAFHREVIARLEALPGVVSASPSVYMSIFSAGEPVAVTSPARPTEPVDALGNPVGPRYFFTMGLSVTEGREFADQDRDGAPRVAILNDVLARRLSPDRSVVGMTITAGGEPFTVVGVVRDAQYYVAGDAPRPQLFTSYWQAPAGDAFLNDSRTFVKVAGDPGAMMADLVRAVAAVDAAVPVSEVAPLSRRVAYMFQPVRMARLLLTGFAVLALVLSAVGLYGVLAFAVAERTREIGLRVAIGASRAQIATLVLREALTMVVAGLAVGVVLAWNSMQFVASLLFGISTRDLSAFAAASVAILLVGALASYLPARRATRVSPLMALRVE
jgi:predicted permease